RRCRAAAARPARPRPTHQHAGVRDEDPHPPVSVCRGWRSNSRFAQRYATRAMPAHQATAMTALWPIGGTHQQATSLSFAGVAGEGEEDVIEVGSVDRQPVDLDRGVVEPVEQGSQRADVAVAGHMQGEGVVVARHRAEGVRGRLEGVWVGELQPDVPAGDTALELFRRARDDQPAVLPWEAIVAQSGVVEHAYQRWVYRRRMTSAFQASLL